MTISTKGDFHCFKIEMLLPLLFKSDLDVCVPFPFHFFSLFLFAGGQKKCTKSQNEGLAPFPSPPCPPLGAQLLVHIPPTLVQSRLSTIQRSFFPPIPVGNENFFTNLLCKFTRYLFFCPCVVATICHACFNFSRFVPRTPSVNGRQVGSNPACVCMQASL